MILDTYDHRLIAALERGLPSVPRPYREIGDGWAWRKPRSSNA